MRTLTPLKEVLMQAVIERVESGESARAVANNLCLSRNTLARRVKNHQYILSEPPNARKLSAKAEDDICEWIVAEEAGGRAPSSSSSSASKVCRIISAVNRWEDSVSAIRK